MTKPQLTATDLATLFYAFNRHDIDGVIADMRAKQPVWHWIREKPA